MGSDDSESKWRAGRKEKSRKQNAGTGGVFLHAAAVLRCCAAAGPSLASIRKWRERRRNPIDSAGSLTC